MSRTLISAGDVPSSGSIMVPPGAIVTPLARDLARERGVELVDVVTTDDGSPIAAGYMSLTRGEFAREFTYDEIQVVLEGELHLGTSDGIRIGRPGDIMFVPKDSKVTFGTPSWTKFIYVTFPANWAG